MAEIAQALHAALVGDPGIAAMVATRVYPRMVPQTAARPAISYRQVSNVPDYHQQGRSGLRTSRYQIVCSADLYEDAIRLAGLVEDLLSGFRGNLGGLEQACVFVDNVLDLADIGPDVRSSAVQVDVLIEHQD